jgi:arsenate reductase
MLTMFCIPNCNTVKKARVSLENKGLEYEFVNFKKSAPTKKQIKEWKAAFGDWPVNKKGPTYRKIKESFEKASAAEKTTMLTETTSAIKRPILMKNDKVIAFGFDEDVYKKL